MAASLEPWDVDSIPGLAQWVKGSSSVGATTTAQIGSLAWEPPTLQAAKKKKESWFLENSA